MSAIRRVPKPWGEEIIFAHTRRYAGKVLRVRAGESLSLQYHERKEETLYLYAGRVKASLESDGRSEDRVLEPGEALHLPPGTRHRLEATEDAVLFEVSTPELDDVVRLEDRYGRQGTREP
jgi:mannose-6-phosphate isomerase-like protein (cupin superfamily)